MRTAFNRFDCIRLLLAGLVFFYHAVSLSSFAALAAYESTFSTVAELSIQGFFVISGLLVYGSLERSDNIADYAGKRVRRLYPAYAVVILIPALVSFLFTFGERDAFGEILRYMAANLVFLNFLEPNLPGLFQTNRFTDVNGALWTLKIEVMFYIALPLIAWVLRKMRGLWWIGIGALVFAAFVWKSALFAYDGAYAAQLSRQLPGQMMFFAAGMAVWRLRASLIPHATSLFCIGLVALTLSLIIPALDALRVLGLSCLIVGIAHMPGPPLKAARWGDISYGVYIVHFPILQGLVMAGVFEQLGWAGGLALATILVFTSSYLLWWWVEKPALRRDSHYRTVSKEEEDDERIRHNHTGRDPRWNSDPNAEPSRST